MSNLLLVSYHFYYSNWITKLQKKSSNFKSAEAMVQRQQCVELTPQLLHHDDDVEEVMFRHDPVPCGTNKPIRKSEFIQSMKVG